MIQIFLLGRMNAAGARQSFADFQTRRGCELLAFFVLEAGRTLHRSRLSKQFWDHLPAAKSGRALNAERWRMTSALKAVGMDVDSAIFRSQTEVGYFRQSDHAVDVDQMRAAMNTLTKTEPEEAYLLSIAPVDAPDQSPRCRCAAGIPAADERPISRCKSGPTGSI